MQDLKQLSRDPNAAEKARRAEKKADVDAGLRVIDTTEASSSAGAGAKNSGGGFKKGGFKSSFTTVKGSIAPTAPSKRNVLGEEDEDDDSTLQDRADSGKLETPTNPALDAESDTDEDYVDDLPGGGYYDPRRPTDCSPDCPGLASGTLVS